MPKADESCFLLLVNVAGVQLISDGIDDVPISTCCWSITSRRSISVSSAAKIKKLILQFYFIFHLHRSGCNR